MFALIPGVLGLLGSVVVIGVVPGLVAVVAGWQGLRETRKPDFTGRGLAKAGLWTGVAACVLGPIFGYVLFLRAFDGWAQVACGSNMRQIGLAAILHADAEPDRLFPPDFDTLLLTQDIQPAAFTCPSSYDEPGTVPLGPGTCSYVWAGAGVPDSAPPTTTIAFERLGHHWGGANVLYADMVVDFETPATITTLVNTAVTEGRLTREQGIEILGK